MPACAEECPLEAEPQSPDSIGPIDDAELICRAAYYSSSANKSGKINIDLIDKKALAGGTLSVWRALGKNGWSLEDTLAHLKTEVPAGARILKAVVGVTAGEVRKAKCEVGRCCVLDETDCGGGKTHPRHAHISPCRHSDIASNPDALRALRDVLWNLYKEDAAQKIAA